jgi:hypothetical protein
MTGFRPLFQPRHRRVDGCPRCRSTWSWRSSPGAGSSAGTRRRITGGAGLITMLTLIAAVILAISGHHIG